MNKMMDTSFGSFSRRTTTTTTGRRQQRPNHSHIMEDKLHHSLPILYSPPIVASVTQDYEGDDDNVDDLSLIPSVDHDADAYSNHSSLFRESQVTEYNVEKFLDLYENMLQMQEKEHSATIAYLRPILEMLEDFSASDGENHDGDSHGSSNKSYLESNSHRHFDMTKEIQYSQLKRAIRRLTSEQELENDNSNSKYHFLKKDIQLDMVLNTLAKQQQHASEDSSISYAEIVQCYKACILGMQTLQGIPASGSIRNRTCDRSMSIVLTFKSPTKTVGSDLQHQLKISSTSSCGGESDETRQTTYYYHIWIHLVVAFFLGGLLVAAINSRNTDTGFNSVKSGSPKDPLLFGEMEPSSSSPLSISAFFVPKQQATTPVMHESPSIFSDHHHVEVVSTSSSFIPGPSDLSVQYHPGFSTASKPMTSMPKTTASRVVGRHQPHDTSSPQAQEMEHQQLKQQTLSSSSSSSSSAQSLQSSTHVSRSVFRSFMKDLVQLHTPPDIDSVLAIGGTVTIIGIAGPVLVHAVSVSAASSMIAYIPVGIAIVTGTLIANGIQDLINSVMKRNRRRRSASSKPH